MNRFSTQYQSTNPFLAQSGVHRYGFNGKEKDFESFGGAYDFGARILDSRLGSWMSLDGFSRLYPSISGYCLALDNSIKNSDIDGNIVQGDVNQFISDISAILCKISGADIFVGLLEANAEKNQVAQISEADFRTALEGLKDNPDAQSLVNGIYQMIVSTNIYQIEYVTDKENLALLVSEEESEARDILLGKTGFDMRSGIANNYDKAQMGEKSKGMFGFVVNVNESRKKYYCLIHADAVSSELYFPALGGNSKTIPALTEYSMLNGMMTGFFKIDPFILGQEGSNTHRPGYAVENLARGLAGEPLVSSNSTAMFYKVPWELEVGSPKGKQKKVRNRTKNNTRDRNKNRNRHGNPRFL